MAKQSMIAGSRELQLDSAGVPLVGRSNHGAGMSHFAVKIDGVQVARCNPRVRLSNFDRQSEPYCYRCMGKDGKS